MNDLHVEFEHFSCT